MMKRWLAIFLSAALIIAVLSFFLLSGPALQTISGSVGVKVSPAAALRVLADTSSWREWWPGAKTSPDRIYNFQGVRYGPPRLFYNDVLLNTREGDQSTYCHLFIIPIDLDSVNLSWTDSFPAARTMLSRWKTRRQIAVRGMQMAKLFGSLQTYLDDPVNVYGIRVIQEISRDSTLISTVFPTPDSPSTAIIYRKLEGMKAFIAANRAKIVNYPMIRVDGKPGAYLTMLAYPVDKVLPDNGEYRFKRFLPWKMLSAEVKGGEPAIRAGYRQFLEYIQDYNFSVMANGFAFLITDRSKEPDSSKWVTRFSVPIP